MKDEQGLFYYPYPNNKSVRMYVRQGIDDIEFRLFNSKEPQLWEEHGWAPYLALQKAFEMYDIKKSGFNPKAAYDIAIARTLLKENQEGS